MVRWHREHNYSIGEKLRLLERHLTPANHQHVVEAARHKSTREVEPLAATLCPQPPVASAIRPLREPTRHARRHEAPVPDAAMLQPAAASMPSGSSTVSSATATLIAATSTESPVTTSRAKPAVAKPLDADRYKLEFTIARDTCEKLRRV